MRTAAILGFCLLLSASTLSAAVHTINPDGTGDYPTIQVAVDACAPDDVIVLSAGIFTGDGNRDVQVMVPSITIRSETGDPTSCVIDCEASGPFDAHRAFTIAFSMVTNVVLQGLTIRNGYGPEGFSIPGGGALLIAYEAGVKVTDCIFEDNASGMTYDNAGGAVYVDYGCTTAFERCVFRHNRAYFGGGLATNHGCAVTLEDCWFIGNEAVRGGGVWGNNTSKVGCVFAGNHAEQGGAVWGNSFNVDYYESCTLWSNWATASGGGIYAQSGYEDPVQIVDTIIAGSQKGAAIGTLGTVTITLSCSNLYGNALGDWIGDIADQIDLNGNFSADPCFCDPDGEDFHLCADSWCLPGHHPWGCDQLVGAFGEGCGDCECGGPVVVAPDTWGGVKDRYR